jgi:hypothetical protein
MFSMFWSLRHLIGSIVSVLGSRKDLILENLALRQQLHWLSRAKRLGGRKPVSQEIRALIFRMAAENPSSLSAMSGARFCISM